MQGRLWKAIDNFDLRRYVQEHFADIREAAGGEELRINCFAPDGCAGVTDTNYKLYVNPSKKRWICFKCGYGKESIQPGTGSLVRFMADVEGCHPVQVRAQLLDTVIPTPAEEFEDALREAFRNSTRRKPKEKKYVEIPKYFLKISDHIINTDTPSFMATKVYWYAKERGIQEQFFYTYDLRFCPAVPFGEPTSWRGRLIFPVYDLEGKARSAVGRAIPGPAKKKKAPWFNWPHSDIGDLLWPLGEQTPNSELVVLTEGVFDALAVRFLAGHHAYCTFGKKISNSQIALLHQLGAKEVILAWDPDAKKEIRTTAKRLSTEFDKVAVFPFMHPAWKQLDLGDMVTDRRRGRQTISIVCQELETAIDIQSNEYIGWLMR